MYNFSSGPTPIKLGSLYEDGFSYEFNLTRENEFINIVLNIITPIGTIIIKETLDINAIAKNIFKKDEYIKKQIKKILRENSIKF